MSNDQSAALLLVITFPMQSEKRSSSIAEDRVAGLPAGWASSLQRLTRRGRTTSVLRNDHTGLSCLELSFIYEVELYFLPGL